MQGFSPAKKRDYLHGNLDHPHAGLDQALLSTRAQFYELARQVNPLRWSKQTRNWSYVDTVVQHTFCNFPDH